MKSIFETASVARSCHHSTFSAKTHINVEKDFPHIKKLSDLLGPRSGFKSYREHVKANLENEQFVLPYLGGWMTDILV
jgi:hypothetical protein